MMCAVLGLTASAWIATSTVRGKFDKTAPDLKSFRQSIYVFSLLSLLFNSLLGLLAAQILIGETPTWWVFLGTLILPLCQMCFIGHLWRKGNASLAAATGIGNIGLVFPYLCLLPIWGPMILWFAR